MPQVERTPTDLREGVRSGILSAIERDADLRGGRTARLLTAAGAVGAFGAMGMALTLTDHPYGHHPHWHEIVFTAAWSAILIVALAIVFLRVNAQGLPLTRSATIGIIGLGVAGVCGALCPDKHFLSWWSATPLGEHVADAGGLALSALCFGAVATTFIGAVAGALGTAQRDRARLRAALPAFALALLLAPGVALQSVGTSWAVFGAWWLGTAIGAYAGVGIGIAARSAISRQASTTAL